MDISCGFVIKSEGDILIGHSTDPYGSTPTLNTGNWTIFKGIKESQGESDLDCALRELFEESNIDLRIFCSVGELESMKSTIEYDMSSNKKVRLFIYNDPFGKLKNIELKCNSFVPELGIPEIDAYKWCSIEEAYQLVFKSQKFIFDGKSVIL